MRWTGDTGRQWRLRRIVKYQLETVPFGGGSWQPMGTPGTEREGRDIAKIIDREDAEAGQTLAKVKQPARQRIRQQSQSARATEMRAADKSWSIAVRDRAGHQCEDENEDGLRCRRKATDAHHLKGKKAHPRLRHDTTNGIALCRPHHQDAHGAPLKFQTWHADWSKRYPERWPR